MFLRTIRNTQAIELVRCDAIASVLSNHTISGPYQTKTGVCQFPEFVCRASLILSCALSEDSL